MSREVRVCIPSDEDFFLLLFFSFLFQCSQRHSSLSLLPSCSSSFNANSLILILSMSYDQSVQFTKFVFNSTVISSTVFIIPYFGNSSTGVYIFLHSILIVLQLYFSYSIQSVSSKITCQYGTDKQDIQYFHILFILCETCFVAVYVDMKTPRPFVEDLSKYGDDGSSAAAAKEDHVYMDAMGFGMGCSCLQMTFQACNINEARVLYDHLTPLCPVMVRLHKRVEISLFC